MFTRLAKALGPKGHYLALCRTIGWVPFPVWVRIFGRVATIPEILNIHDNFADGELRDARIEAVLREAARPVVVDCGVNVGITVRWWFHLNPATRVFGFDMMPEAHALTQQRLAGRPADYVGITAALAATDGEEVTIRFKDPLDGKNRIGGSGEGGGTQRTLLTRRLDSLLDSYALDRIDVLKIDIEGHAAQALLGAAKALAVSQHVILEIHSEEELGEAERILVSAGFRLRRFRNRNLWFTRG